MDHPCQSTSGASSASARAEWFDSGIVHEEIVMTASEMREIPLNKLKPSPANVRRTVTDAGIESHRPFPRRPARTDAGLE